MPHADGNPHLRWRVIEGPTLTIAFIVVQEALRLSGNEALGLRALLMVSLVYYAFRGTRIGATLSALLVWLYLVFAFSFPGQLFFIPEEHPLRIILWGISLVGVALSLRWLGERNLRQLQLLRDREAKLAAITDNMADGLIIIDEQGIIESLNPAAERLFGYRTAEVVGQNVSVLMPEPYASTHNSHIQRYLQTGVSAIMGVPREAVGLRQDGVVIPVEFTINELWVGDTRRFIGSARDITERKRIEAELDFQRKVLEAESEASRDGILVVTRDRHWTHHNRRFAEMWNFPESITLAGDSASAVAAILPQLVDPEEFAARLNYLMEHPDEESNDEMRLKDGRIFERYSAPVRASSGEALGRVWYYRDATGRRQAAEAMQRGNALLDALASSQAAFIRRAGPDQFFGPVLDDLLQLTQSAYGFIGEVLATPDGASYLKTHAIGGVTWDEANLTLVEEHAPTGLEFYNLHTLFGAAITSRQPVIANSPTTDPRRGGLPPGHPPLDCFMGLPIFSGDTVVGLVGIANRPGGYDDALAGYLQPFLTTCGTIIDAYRTEQRQRQAEEERQRLAAVLENTTDLVGISDPQGRSVYLNRAGRRMLGVPDDEDTTGQSFDRWLPSWVYERLVSEGIPAALRDGTWSGETAILGPGGVEIPVSQILVAHKGEQGAIEFLATVIRDLSDRIRAEQQLRDTLEQLQEQYRAADRAQSESRAVLDAAGDAMILIAPDRRILSINRKFTEFFGITPEVAEGRGFHDFQEATERIFTEAGPFLARMAGSVADPERQFTDVLLQRWPQQRELAIYATPVHSAAGEHLGRLYVFHDVTHERAVDRMKNEFVSLVSHELRTPLTSIKGYVDLVLSGEAGEISDQQTEFLEIVKNNADRLVTIINDLLDISRIEAGRIELVRASLDMVQLVRRAAAAVRPQVEAKRQRLTLDLPDRVPMVVADSTRANQVLFNLLSNAYKYTPAGGAITVSVRQEGALLRTSVQDTGIGLSPEEQSQLFTRFFRASNRATQENGGTGLGLAITRSLVEMQGGEITVSSAVGAGSTFSFTLPLVDHLDWTDEGGELPLG